MSETKFYTAWYFFPSHLMYWLQFTYADCGQYSVMNKF